MSFALGLELKYNFVLRFAYVIVSSMYLFINTGEYYYNPWHFSGVAYEIEN